MGKFYNFTTLYIQTIFHLVSIWLNALNSMFIMFKTNQVCFLVLDFYHWKPEGGKIQLHGPKLQTKVIMALR